MLGIFLLGVNRAGGERYHASIGVLYVFGKVTSEETMDACIGGYKNCKGYYIVEVAGGACSIEKV